MGGVIAGQPRGPARRRAVWDLIMVVLALADLTLIGFDLTYVHLRSLYQRVAPGVVRLYDPVKGIRPHPTSERLLAQMRATESYLDRLRGAAPDPLALQEQVTLLRALSVEALRDGAFGFEENAELEQGLRAVVGRDAGLDPADLASPAVKREAVRRLWPADAPALAARLSREEGPVLRALRRNYYRDVDPDGAPVDHFVWVEMPILALFWIDFALGWALSARRPREQPWYRYPLTHWYDVVGLLPGELRLFRLLRLVSLYLRIYRGELHEVRDNVMRRLTLRLAGLVAGEVTNRVQVQVVRRLEEELASGTIHQTFADGLRQQRAAIVEAVIDQLRHVSSDPTTQARARELVALATEEALAQGHHFPFARGLTRSAVDRAAGTVLESLGRTLQSEDGREALRRLAFAAAASAGTEPSSGRLSAVVSGISLDVVRALGASAEQRFWGAGTSAPPEADVPAPQTRGEARPLSPRRTQTAGA